MLGISGRYCSACRLLTCTEPRDLRPIWSLPIEPGRGSHGLQLPDDAVKSVDAIVAKSDGAHFLLATVYYVPSATPAQRREGKLTFPKPIRLRRPGKSREGAPQPHANIVQLATEEKNGPFSPKFGEGFGMELSNSDQPHSAA